jgi:hypothetical protein
MQPVKATHAQPICILDALQQNVKYIQYDVIEPRTTSPRLLRHVSILIDISTAWVRGTRNDSPGAA